MSADLFAAFEDFSTPPPPVTNTKSSKPSQSQFSQPSALNDPFASIGSNFASQQTPQSQSNFQWLSTAQHPRPQQNNDGGWGGFEAFSKPQAANTEDDDGWGDFEVASPAPQAAVTSLAQWPTSIPSGSNNTKKAEVPQRNRPIRASTVDLMTNNLVDIAGSSKPSVEKHSPSWSKPSLDHWEQPRQSATKAKVAPRTTDPNVLFDADDFDGGEDDDFGDFETGTTEQKPAAELLSEDLWTPPATAKRAPADIFSALQITPQPLSGYPQAPKSPGFQERNPFPGLAVTAPVKPKSDDEANPKASPVTAWPTIEQNEDFGEDWAAFEDLPVKGPVSQPATKPSVNAVKKPLAKSTAKPAPKPNSTSPTNWDWDADDTVQDAPAQQVSDGPPPINVPPPSVLLSLLPQLLETANTALYKPVGGQTFSTKNRIMSDPKTIEFLRGYLALCTVAARIIAGRKLRWHRDKFLSQSMSISAAGSRGMKLAGVDKAQAAREDREAADVVDVWKDHVGRLRSAVAAANLSIPDPTRHLKIPEISEHMALQATKIAPTAPKSCIVCGLKRDERLAKIDHDVEDSFGEWWADHWGHRACKNFWLQHEKELRQR